MILLSNFSYNWLREQQLQRISSASSSSYLSHELVSVMTTHTQPMKGLRGTILLDYFIENVSNFLNFSSPVCKLSPNRAAASNSRVWHKPKPRCIFCWSVFEIRYDNITVSSQHFKTLTRLRYGTKFERVKHFSSAEAIVFCDGGRRTSCDLRRLSQQKFSISQTRW